MDVFEIPMNEILGILNKADKDHIFKATKSDISKIYDLFTYLIEFSKKNSVGIVLNEFLNKSGYLNHLIENEKYEEMDNNTNKLNNKLFIIFNLGSTLFSIN